MIFIADKIIESLRKNTSSVWLCNNFFALIVTACLSTLSFPSSSNAYDPLTVTLPDAPVIPGASWFWVGRKMAIDGLPISIKMFTFFGKEEELTRFYDSEWQTAGHGQLVVRKLAGTNVLGHELDGYYTSVQYTVLGEKIDGKIVVSVVPTKMYHQSKSTIPTPPGAKVISRVESLDDGRRSETLTLVLMKSMEMGRDYYLNQLETMGWKQLFASRDPTGYLGQFQSNDGQLQINIKPLPASNGKSSQILVHWLKQ